MRASAAAVGVVVLCSLACGNGQPDEADLLGIWGVEQDDGTWLVREIALDPMTGYLPVRELVVAPGAEPVVFRTGQVYLEYDYTLPGGEAAPAVLVTFYGDPREADGRLSGTTAVDVVEELNAGDHLTLRGPFDEEAVKYEHLDGLPN